jgi:carboxypeptidase Taq
MKDLVTRWGEYEDVYRAHMILEWDQETYLPQGGAEARSMQSSALAGIAHEKLASKKFRAALDSAARRKKLTPKERAMIREARRAHLRAVRIPEALVRESARAESRGLMAWRKAYTTNNWRSFAGNLDEIVRLKKRIAEHVGYAGVPYDAHLDVFEPGATVRHLDPFLEDIKEAIPPLVRKIARSKRKPNPQTLRGHYPHQKQLEFGRRVVEDMGFDFTKGRIDLTTHPFCTSFDPGDVRLTTRVLEDDPRVCLFGLIHEAGHGLYEQGIDRAIVRTPVGHAVSLGIHESQSRLWENVVGRSREYWIHYLPEMKKVFPGPLRGVRLDDFYFAINEVIPSFVRTEADEVTYNLHIVMRYEIEKDLFAEKIKTAELPGIWNAKMKSLLGITPPTDSLGVLQDIHWSQGLFGYFPTYFLGNLYGAQLWERAKKDVPRLNARIAKGQLLPLRDWLRKNVHGSGRTYTADELIRRATGTKLQSRPFLRYVEEKFGELYDL